MTQRHAISARDVRRERHKSMFKSKKVAKATGDGIRINFKTPSGLESAFSNHFNSVSDEYAFMDEIDACGWDANGIIDVCKRYRVHNVFDTPVYSILRNTQNEIVIQLDSAGGLAIFRKGAPVNASVKKSANTYQDALNLPAYNMDAYIQSAAECVNAVFSGAELLEQAASWAEYNADGPSMEFADKIGDMAAEAYVLGKDFADAWDAGARSAGRHSFRKVGMDGPQYAIADKYRTTQDAMRYVDMSDDDIMRETARYAAYCWFDWSGSFDPISESHFNSVINDAFGRVAISIYRAKAYVESGYEDENARRELRNSDPDTWEALVNSTEEFIDESCNRILPGVERILRDVIEDCRACVESI